MLGGSVHSKGANVFIEAAKITLKKYPETYFLIAGYPLKPSFGNPNNNFFINLKYKVKNI